MFSSGRPGPARGECLDSGKGLGPHRSPRGHPQGPASCTRNTRGCCSEGEAQEQASELLFLIILLPTFLGFWKAPSALWPSLQLDEALPRYPVQTLSARGGGGLSLGPCLRLGPGASAGPVLFHSCGPQGGCLVPRSPLGWLRSSRVTAGCQGSHRERVLMALMLS